MLYNTLEDLYSKAFLLDEETEKFYAAETYDGSYILYQTDNRDELHISKSKNIFYIKFTPKASGKMRWNLAVASDTVEIDPLFKDGVLELSDVHSEIIGFQAYMEDRLKAHAEEKAYSDSVCKQLMEMV